MFDVEIFEPAEDDVTTKTLLIASSYLSVQYII